MHKSCSDFFFCHDTQVDLWLVQLVLVAGSVPTIVAGRFMPKALFCHIIMVCFVYLNR